jgi:futalosine hydrolase
VDLEGCEALSQATRGCRLVLLTATEGEAEPLLGALLAPEPYVVATKKLFVGRLAPGRCPASGRVAAEPVPTTLAISGCDKANAAHVLTCLLQAMRPKPLLVLQVGVGGAFPHIGQGVGGQKIGPHAGAHNGTQLGAGVGDVVIATREVYSDTGSSSPAGWLSPEELGLPMARVNGRELGGDFPLDAGLVVAAAAAIEAAAWPEPRPRVITGPCVTASRVTGLLTEGEEVVRRWGAVAESMEGAAAAHICALYGVPFLEVRGISNLVVDRDRGSWEIGRAAAVAARAALAIAAALDRLPLSSAGAPRAEGPFAAAPSAGPGSAPQGNGKA